MTANSTVFRHVADEGARLRPNNSRGDAIAEKESSPMSFPFPHPRFPGKSREYVASYLAYEANAASGGRAYATTERRDVIESRTDAEVYAAHEARMRKIYTDSFSQDAPDGQRRDAGSRRDALRASHPYGTEMTDAEIDICLERVDRMDQYEESAAAARSRVTHRLDATTQSRIDSAAAAANLSPGEVADHIRMNHPTHRGYTPSVEDIDNAIDQVAHAVRMRKIYTDSFGVR